jgi:hypothetical protein
MSCLASLPLLLFILWPLHKNTRIDLVYRSYAHVSFIIPGVPGCVRGVLAGFYLWVWTVTL